jgi:signal transduction histidine kinase
MSSVAARRTVFPEWRWGDASDDSDSISSLVTTRTAANPGPPALERAGCRGVAGRPGDSIGVRGRLGTRAHRLWSPVPPTWRLLGIAAVGAAAAAAVGYAVSKNPAAAPAHLAVLGRVVIIGGFIGAGLYAQTSPIQARMGGLLVAAGLWASLWLLNGSNSHLLFSVGVLCTGVIPTIAAYLMLAHPSGRLRSRGEQRFVWFIGGTTTALWILVVVMTGQVPVKTPLLQCTPHCIANEFSLGSTSEVVGVIKVAVSMVWIVLTCGTAVLVIARARSAPGPTRRSLAPVAVIATALAILLTTYLSLQAAGVTLSTAIGAAYFSVGIAIPVAVLVGLSTERMVMGQALADFLSQLASRPDADPEGMLAGAVGDPSLRIYYRRPGHPIYIDSSGSPVSDVRDDRAVTWFDRDQKAVAAVVYSGDLSDQERFIHAAGAAALIRLEKTQAEAELKASTADLAASRVRLVEMATAERRRLERDLHDGVQQHLVGLRLKLELAAETFKEDPVAGAQALAWLGRQMDGVLDELRSLARGIYPSLLGERGLRDALKAAALTSPIPVEVRASGVDRYGQDLEVAVYFCCLEAIQNVVKHGGRNASATVTLWAAAGRLNFEVRNPGIGFDPDRVQGGNGLINMRDRIDAVGGTLLVASTRGRGVRVRGSVPVA